MSAIKNSVVTLRVYGDDLIPEDITRMLGVLPTYGVTKGQEKISKKTGKSMINRQTGKPIVAKSGMWQYSASDREPEDIDGQIKEIFSKVSADITVWQSITKKYQTNLFCGLFMSEENDGLSISPQSLAILAERGIELWFAIYAPSRNISPIDPCPCNSGKTFAECCAPKANA
jgi:hypothetical protein